MFDQEFFVWTLLSFIEIFHDILHMVYFGEFDLLYYVTLILQVRVRNNVTHPVTVHQSGQCRHHKRSDVHSPVRLPRNNRQCTLLVLRAAQTGWCGVIYSQNAVLLLLRQC